MFSERRNSKHFIGCLFLYPVNLGKDRFFVDTHVARVRWDSKTFSIYSSEPIGCVSILKPWKKHVENTKRNIFIRIMQISHSCRRRPNPAPRKRDIHQTNDGFTFQSRHHNIKRAKAGYQSSTPQY